jgi:hypothetical protein
VTVAGVGVGYPRRPPLRSGLDIRRSLDIVCSISQNIQTNAVPKAITIIKNINVSSGAVVMFNPLMRREQQPAAESKQ